MKPSEKLAELGLVLPNVTAPIGSYVPAIQTGNLVFTSGQLPITDGKLLAVGKIPNDVSLEDAASGARIAALNGVAAIANIAGGIDRIVKIVRVCVFVNSGVGFTQQPKVANGASDLLANIFGEFGKHARSAIGVAELPMNAAVEIELMAEVALG